MTSVVILGLRLPCTLPGWGSTPAPCSILRLLAYCCGCSQKQIRWVTTCTLLRLSKWKSNIAPVMVAHSSPMTCAHSTSHTQKSQDICCVVFALFNVIWATLFLERWKRREAELAFQWGTLDTPAESIEEPRPQFRVRPATPDCHAHPCTSLFFHLKLQTIKEDIISTGREAL